jgi:acyl carrier protein
MTAPSLHWIARNALARHIQRDIRGIPMWYSLSRDLRLTPLGLVTLVLDIEEAARVDVSLDELTHLETVGDLFMCLSKAASTTVPGRGSPYPKPRATRAA